MQAVSNSRSASTSSKRSEEASKTPPDTPETALEHLYSEEHFDEINTYKLIITYMRPKESITKSLRRLGGNNEKLSSIERLRRKKAGTLSSNKEVTELTELVDKILTNMGNMDVYQEAYEEITQKKRDFCKASDLLAKSKEQRRRSASTSSKRSEEASKTPPDTPETPLEHLYSEEDTKPKENGGNSGFELKMCDNVRKYLEEKYEIFDNMIKQSKLISEEMERQKKANREARREARKNEENSKQKIKSLFGDDLDSGEESSTKKNHDHRRHKDPTLSIAGSSKDPNDKNKVKIHENIDINRKRPHTKEDRVEDAKKIKVNKDPNVAEKQNSCKVKSRRLGKTEIGLLVVKLLTPAYADRRFDSRDTFKSMARTISHSLLDKDEMEIKKFVANFLKKNEEITAATTL